MLDFLFVFSPVTVKCPDVSVEPTACIFTATYLLQMDTEVIVRSKANDPYFTTHARSTFGLSSYISKRSTRTEHLSSSDS